MSMPVRRGRDRLCLPCRLVLSLVLVALPWLWVSPAAGDESAGSVPVPDLRADAGGAEPEEGRDAAGEAAGEAAPAVEVSLSTDLVSRYVWRGLSFSDSPCLQPSLGVTWMGFTLSTWGSYAFSSGRMETPDSTTTTWAEAYSEVDLALSRSVETPAGTLTATVNAYYAPSEGISYFEWGDEDGGHVIELALSLDLPGRVPLSLLVARNVHHDPDNSTFGCASLPLLEGDTSLSASLGVAFGESAWYGVDSDQPEIVEVGFQASRSLDLGHGVAPTLGVSYIVNPFLERPYLIASIGF